VTPGQLPARVLKGGDGAGIHIHIGTYLVVMLACGVGNIDRQTDQSETPNPREIRLYIQTTSYYTHLSYRLVAESKHVAPGVDTAPPLKGLRSCDIWHLAHMPSEDPVRGIGTRAGSLGSLFCL
jgi:hypothetical protein